jgi:hyperosmotically inducible protein
MERRRFFRTAWYAFLALVALALLAPALHASDPKAPASAWFRKLDKDRDGYLSRKEVSGVAAYAKAFDEADENRDGRLDPAEFVNLETIVQRAKLPGSTDDKVITEKVKAALLKEPELNAADIDVKTQGGRVLLTGAIRDEKQREVALKVAASVEGVVAVKDVLSVR